MVNSIGDKHVGLWRAPKNCTERLKHKRKEIQYQLKRLQLGNSEHFQLCSVDYLA